MFRMIFVPEINGRIITRVSVGLQDAAFKAVQKLQHVFTTPGPFKIVKMNGMRFFPASHYP